MPYPIIDALAGQSVLLNGKLLSADAAEAGFLFQPQDERMYYEVIRVVQRVPLFLEDHLERLNRSVDRSFAIPSDLAAEGQMLVKANSLTEANLRIVLTRHLRVMHLTPSYYPDNQMIAEGVATGILLWERPDPNTKVIHADYKQAVAERFARPGPFGPCSELLLADRQGYLTEGSRSNLFFISGNQVVSAPDERVLLGITRRYVLQAIADAQLELTVDLLTLDDVRRRGIRTAFLSGSPIDLLPIRAIEDLPMESAHDPFFIKLYKAYMQLLQNYIDQHRVQ